MLRLAYEVRPFRGLPFRRRLEKHSHVVPDEHAAVLVKFSRFHVATLPRREGYLFFVARCKHIFNWYEAFRIDIASVLKVKEGSIAEYEPPSLPAANNSDNTKIRVDDKEAHTRHVK
jgi:hypothetical protein